MIDKRLEILKSGKELFEKKGFKKTNVAGITQLAGMATGTFYNYFTSKNDLFMEIFIEENRLLKKNIMNQVDLEGHPLEVIRQLMYLNMKGMKDNPILKEWYNRDVFSKIEQIYREENGKEHVDFVYDAFIDVILKWQKDEKLRSDIHAEMIMAIFTALISVDTHKDEIGLEHFPEIMNHLVRFTMEGLMQV